MKIFILLILMLTAPLAGFAGTLTPAQINRVTVAKQLLGGADPRTVGAISAELAKSRHTEGDLQILEAVAKTYKEMITEYPQATQSKKEWLHSMVLLNMAFFQFGGNSEANDTGLNITIRRKLKKYLSPELLADPNLFYSLE